MLLPDGRVVVCRQKTPPEGNILLSKFLIFRKKKKKKKKNLYERNKLYMRYRMAFTMNYIAYY